MLNKLIGTEKLERKILSPKKKPGGLQTKIKHGSPLTESSLALLGAGTKYGE